MLKNSPLTTIITWLLLLILLPACDAAANSASQAPTAEPRPTRPPADERAKGDLNAPVTLIEYGDYQCPYCQVFVRGTLPELEKLYVETGQVRYIFRDYPQAGIHTSAVRQAHAAHCAAEQDRYWEMHDLLYDQVDLLTGIREADFTTLDKFANDLGLDIAAFTECMESRRYLERITQDFEEAKALGIRGTPAYVVNGEILFGLYPTGAWQKIIERKLAEAGQPTKQPE